MQKKAILHIIGTIAIFTFFTNCKDTSNSKPKTQNSKPTIEEWVYITNEDSEDLSVISTLTNEVVATIPVGKRPRGIRIAPDGKSVFVAISGSPKCPPWVNQEECKAQKSDKTKDGIAQIDVINKKILRILPAGSDPEQFDITMDSKHLIIANEDVGKASLLDIETQKMKAKTDVGKEPEGVKLSPDNSICYVTSESDHSIAVLKTSTGALLSKVKVGLRPRDIVFTQDGKRAYVSGEADASITVIDVATSQALSTFRLPAGSMPVGLVLSLDEKQLYVANGRGKTVSAIDVTNGQTLNIVEVGKRPWGIGMSSDGKFLYTANGTSNDVSVVDVETFTVVFTTVKDTCWERVLGCGCG
jgi:YVTN family beta-propeller protein